MKNQILAAACRRKAISIRQRKARGVASEINSAQGAASQRQKEYLGAAATAASAHIGDLVDMYQRKPAKQHVAASA